MRAHPIDLSDVESEINVGFVIGDPQRFQFQRSRNGGAWCRRRVNRGTPTPVGGVAVDSDSRFRWPRAHGDDTVVLFGVQSVEPELLAVERILEVDRNPVLFEPLVYELEKAGSGSTRLVDIACQPRIDRGLLVFGEAAVVPSLWLEVSDAPRRWNSIFTDDHGHVAVVRDQRSQIADVITRSL